MGLADIVRNGVALADNLTSDLQPLVQHRAWTGLDGLGNPSYSPLVPRAAIVEYKQRMVRRANGEEVVSTHTITILRPIDPNGAAGREEPIDPRDLFVLPDGTTGPILSITGFVDKGTGANFFAQVFL